MKRLILIVMVIVCMGCAPVMLTPYYKGDCVDRAVSLRQHLKKRGYEAKLVVGTLKKGDKVLGHMWVEYKDKETGEWKAIVNY